MTKTKDEALAAIEKACGTLADDGHIDLAWMIRAVVDGWHGETAEPPTGISEARDYMAVYAVAKDLG